MTISVDKAKITLPGNNDRTIFDFDFAVPEGAGVKIWVSLNGADEIDDTSNATVTLNEDQKDFPGGTVGYPVSGDTLTIDDNIIIKRDSLFTQLVSYEENTPLDMESIETQLDIASLERQELKSRISDLVPPAPTFVPVVADPLLHGITRLDRPRFSVIWGSVLLINGGAFAISGKANPSLGYVITNEEIDKSCYLANPNINTTYYLYLDYNEVVKSGGTVLTSSMLSYSTTVPAVPTDGRDGYYWGNKKCIWAVKTTPLGYFFPFMHDGSDMVLYGKHHLAGVKLLTEEWQKVYISNVVPVISEKVLVTVQAVSNLFDSVELYARSSEEGTGHLISYLKDSTAIQTTIFTGYDSIADSRYIEFKIGSSATHDENILVYINGYYLPRGI